MQFLSKQLLGPLEDVVSKAQGRKWRVRNSKDLSEFACHPCAILSGDSLAVFAKFSQASEAATQFEIEQDSLLFLSKNTGVLVPTPIAIVPVETGTLFIMEALNPVERTPLQWRQIGKTLARIHRVRSDFCGFHMNNFFGPLEQDNAYTQDWATFFGERRLKPRLRMAIDSGNLPVSVVSQVESVIERLPELCGPATTPVLLHGDAQQNNFISTAKGTFVIDPAIYYGNPELDLAFIDYFQPVPEDVFDGYREEMPIAPDFFERRDLWQISGYLAAVAVEGLAYLGRLTDALQKYL